MRKVMTAAALFGAMLGVTGVAVAADMPDLPLLRGSFPEGIVSGPRPIWQGYYIGGQVGYGASDENFKDATRTQLGNLLANTNIENEFQVSTWPQLGKASARNSAFGGFAGYNSQWEDVVIGVELNYMHGKGGGSDSTTIARNINTADSYLTSVAVNTNAAINITDYGTLRGRAGYMIGSFLPYMFGGFAMGRADIVRQSSVTVSGLYLGTVPNTPPAYGPVTLSANDRQNGHFLYGYSAGVGVDVNLIGGLFARAEYEYIRFTSTIDTNVSTVRAGLGYKF
jgi:opacity protein-like surface antigen